MNYSANDRELLGLIGFLKHFRRFWNLSTNASPGQGTCAGRCPVESKAWKNLLNVQNITTIDGDLTTQRKFKAKLKTDQFFGLIGIQNFTSQFWKHLIKLLDLKLKMSTRNHPQSDRQSEVLNKSLAEYLRLFCSHKQTNWDEHVAIAEFACSSSVFEATGLTPFVMDMGGRPRVRYNCCRDDTRAEISL
eukprot:IDg2558t1